MNNYIVRSGKYERKFTSRQRAMEYAQWKAMDNPWTNYRVYRVKDGKETLLVDYWFDHKLQYQKGA